MSDYNIALYIRLSVEDSKTDSLSISNQRLILREKALSLSEYNGGELMEFVDNGHTGMNFERPAVQELLALVQSGKIDCIIVKDLSRFGRNSIETGFFIERVFPLYHTRFISVSDDFDTQNYKGDTGGIDVAFKYLISECYSRDMSMKTRSAKYAKMRRGEYQSVICPYGYGKSADGRMEPDGVAADVVRTIFTLASKGISATDIGRKLYEEKIPTPGEYRAAKGRPIHDTRRTGGVWVTSTILRIIRDERYTGAYIIGKREVTEIGGSHSRMKDESKWIKIPNHHETIVSIDLYNRANKALRHFSQPNKQIHHYPLKGKVFCGYCDHAMSRKGKNTVFYCRHSEVSENLPCYGLQIKAADLEKVIFDTLRAQLLPVLGIDADKDNVTVQTMQQVEYESKLQSLRDKKRMLYEQYVFDEIDLDAYKAQKDSLDAEVVNAKNAYTAISARTKQAEADYELRQKQQATARELSDAKSLTQSLSDRLISRVYIFKDNRIEIDYICNDFLAPN